MDDDQQQHLITEAINHAAAGDYFKISAIMVDAILESRQDLIDSSISVIIGDKEPF